MILVTGGAGFIGSTLVAALNAAGRGDIAVSDRLRHGPKWRNLAKREIRDFIFPEDLPAYLAERGAAIEAVLHMGAVSSTTETDADLIVRSNFQLSAALWDFCAARQIPLIYASSAATYGDGGAGFDDDGSPDALARLAPLNAYGWSKHAFDRRIARLLATGGPAPPQWAGLKFFNVYGPNEYHKGAMQSVVAQIFPKARAGEPCRLFRSHHPDYADGGQMRDFVLVDDCVNVMLWLLDNPGVSGLFNMGTGTPRSFADLATAVYRALGRDPEIEFIDTPANIRDKYQYYTAAEMDRLRQAGCDVPFTTLEEGVTFYVSEFLNTDDPYR